MKRKSEDVANYPSYDDRTGYKYPRYYQENQTRDYDGNNYHCLSNDHRKITNNSLYTSSAAKKSSDSYREIISSSSSSVFFYSELLKSLFV